MKEAEFLKEIGITDSGEYDTNDVYVIDIMDYDTFGKYYSKLEKSDLVEEIPSTSMINIHTTDVMYQSVSDEPDNSFIIKIMGDLDNNDYKLTCQKT